jgi:ABC-type uncharacterized transport system substrate-binding protein
MGLAEKKYNVTGFRMLIFLFVLFLYSCSHSGKRTILYINSYHEGYPPSDEAMRAIREAFPDGKYSLQIRFLDAKRNPSQEWLRHAADSFANEISVIKPGAVILSDDDAVKYMRSFIEQNPAIPFVFCGVNWSAGQYKLPRRNVTGMVEVLPLRQAIQELFKIYPDIWNIAILSENSLSEQNNTLLLDTLYRNMGLTPEYHLVESFETWKERFVILQATADLIYIPTNGAIAGWDAADAASWVETNIKKPVFTCDDFMMPYAVFGLTKIPREQGEWASSSVKRILGGTAPEEIPFASNRQSKIWLNQRLAEKIGFNPGPELIKDSNIIK